MSVLAHNEHLVFAIKRADGKIFKVGDKFTYKGNTAKLIVNGKVSKRKMKICGFEQHDKGWYVLYYPQYHNGVIEKENGWRACDISSAIVIE